MSAELARALKASNGVGFDELWSNREYEVFVRRLEPARGRGGALHLSIKRYDRDAIHDWRHLQSIKNEVAGSEREAIELFPAESRLVDGANQTHLWVGPAGEQIGIGFHDGRQLATQEEGYAAVIAAGQAPEIAAQGRQRPWQPGLSTGPGYFQPTDREGADA